MIRPRTEVRVVHRNLRWEVTVNGLSRPMVDWLCTRERAIDHAIERARELAGLDGRSVALVFPTTAGGEERTMMIEEDSEAPAELAS